ncbi:hypothetical protein IBO79_003989 [Salmonella enterica]|nr:hypothetical protein [Salmonella enterica subsp. enterica serovar Johannesburg]EBA8633437.1 hypothetical protein [Salmonella enterica]EBY2674775.1 hypothetical protein [Salmonella enterica subsp. enterica serovar Schwarzengrund]ECZ9826713.1 hypothetical protein [Salmonella enterica subsp. enterica serovar Sandiego]EDF0193546.1 hypothetical protein [Salmonella enterica subsp. enterica serovar Enteritidis]EDL9740729.1 hypothetical protein [Salmonella enterica subsp. enterica serovar Newport]
MNDDKTKRNNAGHSVILTKAKTGMQISPELLKQFETLAMDAGKAIIENCPTRIELKQNS